MMAAMTHYLFDLGNSRLKYAPLRDDGRVGDVVAIAHDGDALPADWDAALPTRFDAAALTTVGSAALRTQLLDALTARCGRISIARTVARFGSLRIAYPNPEALGTDRFLAMLGARARGAHAADEHATDALAANELAGGTRPWLVVGIGTAITLDLVDADGLHRGGDGTRRIYRLLSGSAEISYRGERHLSGAAGAQGGGSGWPATCRLVGHDGVRHLPSKARVAWSAGERLIIETAGGGGWGRPTGETA